MPYIHVIFWYRSAELALAEANLQDPEHPGVWAQLAVLALLTGKQDDAAQALKQAQRYGLAEHPRLLVELADRYQEMQLFGTAGGLLATAAAVQDSMQVRLVPGECQGIT
jgi:cytochrome c-type biogenesis protein CcmH/NrfG